VKMGGMILKNVRFVDDQGMTASTEAVLQNLLDLLNAAKFFNMKIKVKITKTLSVKKGC